MKCVVLSLIVILSIPCASAAPIRLGEGASVSVLTCGPGDELYFAFGHTAFRIKDPDRNIDVVFNYGTFDFDASNFYLRFALGNSIYKLSAYDFVHFPTSYVREGRWVKEQVLNLTLEEKNKIFEFLMHNALPENADYRYDYFTDNCATKIIEVLKSTLGDDLRFSNQRIDRVFTYRQLIRQYVPDNSWSSLAIVIPLGSPLDKTLTAEECMFLPEMVFEGLSRATITRDPTSSPLVQETLILFEGDAEKKDQSLTISPIVTWVILGCVLFLFSRVKNKNGSALKLFDALIFFMTGVVGIVLLFLWLFTDHDAAANNLNILWAFPGNVIVSITFLRLSKPRWHRVYFIVLLSLLILLVVAWITNVQNFSWALLPLFILLGVRYYMLSRQR